MASPASSLTLEKPLSDGSAIPEEHAQHDASETHDSQPNSAQDEPKEALKRTHKREKPAEEGWASKLAGEAEKEADIMKRRAEVVENLSVTAEKALEEMDRRVDEAEAVTKEALHLATVVGGGIMPEVAEDAVVAVETAKVSVETAEVIVEGVETVSKVIGLDADRLHSILEQSKTHEDSTVSTDAVPPKEKKLEKEPNEDKSSPTSVEQIETNEASNKPGDGEPPKKKPKQEEEVVGSS